EDIGVDAVKVGMLGTGEVTLAVARALDELPPGTPVVVDPVMVSESGARLLDPGAERALIEEILPRASVLTPNLPAARVLAGAASAPRGDAADPPRSRTAETGQRADPSPAAASLAEEDAEARALVRAVLALGPAVVVLTGGHRARASDVFLESANAEESVSI